MFLPYRRNSPIASIASGNLFTKSGRLVGFVQQVGSALERLNDGTYEICEIYNESIEESYLRSEPLVRACLAHLSEAQQLAVGRDLQLAFEKQFRMNAVVCSD